MREQVIPQKVGNRSGVSAKRAAGGVVPATACVVRLQACRWARVCGRY